MRSTSLSFLGLAAGLFYVGLLPDIASLRDRACERARDGNSGHLVAQLYGIAALGWRGSIIHWHRWSHAYRGLAVLCVLVVVALQTGAAVMFAGTVEPGWHDTLLPVTYLVGAVFSGVGMLSVLTVIIRHVFALETMITARHIRVLALLMLGLCAANIYCEAATDFTTLLGGEAADMAALGRRVGGPVAWSFWMLVTAGFLPPLLFLIPSFRARPGILAWVGGAAAAGIWGDHYTLIVASLQHDYLPSAAQATHITFFEWTTFAGSAGLFLFLLLLFLRLLPVISMLGARELVSNTGAGPEGAAPWPPHEAPLWGVAGEFATARGMAAAARVLRGAPGYRIDAYAPMPNPEVAAELGMHAGHATWAWAAGVAGGGTMFGMCVWATAYDYVFDIGGRPRFSWPAFLVPTASFACLCAGTAVVAAMLVQNRFPRLNHPSFNIPGIGRATQDRFFVVAHALEGEFDPEPAERLFANLNDPALTVSQVPR